MALETAIALARDLLNLNPIILLAIVIALVYLGFRLFSLLLRVLLTRLAFASFPVIANLIGIPVPLTLQTILWSAITGIVLYFVYVSLSFGNKLINLALSPFKKTFAKKPKAREKEK